MLFHESLSRTGLLVAGIASLSIALFAYIGASARGDEPSRLPPNASEAQRAELADGQVTIEEVEASVQREISCLEAAGATVSVSPGRGLRPTRFSAKFPASGAAPSDAAFAEVHTAGRQCDDSEAAAVTARWAEQVGDPSEAALAGLYGTLEQCLSDGGSPPDRPALAAGLGAFGTYRGAPTLTAGSWDIVTYRECALAAEAETGLLPPPPPQ
ncbi:MAG: hypothetical protein ABI577_15505 [bacterium]